jgi:ABC-type multidrug transport system fused ATPase/permease subunit
MRVCFRSPAWVEAGALLRRHRGPLVLALLLVVVNRVAALALPAASKYVVDEVIVGRRPGLLLPVALVVCTAVVVEAAAAFGAAHLAGVAGQRAIAEVRRGLQERVLRLPLRRIDAAQSGTLAARVMADSEQVRYLVGTGLVQLASSVLTATLALAVLSWFNASAAFALLVILAVVLVGLAGGFRRIFATLATLTHLRAELTGRLVEAVGGARVVKAYVAERREAHRFTKQAHRLLRQSIRAIRGISLFNAGTTLVAGAMGGLVLIIGGRAVAGGTMSLGSLVMYVSLTGFLLGPVVQIAAAAGDLGNAVAALERIAELRACATEAEEDRSLGRLPQVDGTVDFDHVSYAYVPGQLALRGVSLHAPAGSTIALVGPNGSGKSTLCRLLLAHDRPTAGRILIDGRDLAGLRRRDYRSRVGVVLQDDLLFDGTIAENIRYGRPGAPLADVLAAGRLARCDDFAEALAAGYETRVGERGMRLSGGQRQRIAIARAILMDPRILVLDEATSHLDSESELLVQAALRTLCRERTTFVIAHRLSTVRCADQILVIDRGVIVERGTHAELLAHSGCYTRLCRTRRTFETANSATAMRRLTPIAALKES